MKGYTTENGYMGYVGGSYQLFASEADYREWMEDQFETMCYKIPTCDIIGITYQSEDTAYAKGNESEI